MIKPENTPHPFGGFVYPYAAGLCLDPTCSGTVTKSEVDVQLTLKSDDYRDSLAYAAQMVSVLAKQRWPRRSLWQRICGWFRYQLGL